MGDSKKMLQVRSARQVPVRVIMLDDELFNDSVDKRAIGWVLFERVCESLNLIEKDYFGLTYFDATTGLKFWLNNDKKITKQLKGSNWDFKFEVKFYPPDPSQLTEDLTRYQLCLQIRRDMVNEKLPCSFVTYTLLGSYTAQSELGDYDAEEFGHGTSYLKEIKFAPHQDRELLQKIAELHRQHKGQTPEEAELHFLENAKKLAMYGVELHTARDAEGEKIKLGICASGIIVYKDKVQMNRFVWPKVLKISYRRKKFYIKIRPGEFEEFASLIGFRCDSIILAKRLWKISVEHHSFFRFREADMPKKVGLFPRFGSRFRYSGRTQFQSKQAVAEEDRESPFFDRVMSKRGTFSARTPAQRNKDEERALRRDLRERDRYRRDRPEPPEPTKAPPVAPKPKPSPRGPPSVDDDHSEKGHPDSINDSFEDVHVPDRRSKIEKIHGVATPLSQVLQKSMEKADKSDHEDENSHGPPGYTTQDHNEDRRHQVGKLSAISQNSEYLFSYPSSSVDSNLSDNCGDYDTCKPLKAHRNRTSSESYMSRSSKPAANRLHHSITDLPKAASEGHEMNRSQEQIYAEIDALKGSNSSSIEPFGKSFGETRASQPKVYGRRSKHYTKNQKQSRPAMNAPNAQPSLQNVAMTDLLLDTPSSVSLAAINKPTPKYAKINKKPSFKQENPVQTNANDHLSTTKQKDDGVEYTPHSKVAENTLLAKNKEKIREEFKMYILSPQNQDNKETKTNEPNSKVADKIGTLSNANKPSFQCVTPNTDVIEQSDCYNIRENKSAFIGALEKNETLKSCIDSDQKDHNYTVDGFDMERFETHASRKPSWMDGESYNAHDPDKESNYILPKFEMQGHSKNLEECPDVAKDVPSFATSGNFSRYKIETASDDNVTGLENHVDGHMNERDKFGHSKHLEEFPDVAKDAPSFATFGNSSRCKMETASDDNCKGLENHVDAHMKERDKLYRKSIPESNAECDAHMKERDKLYHKSVPRSNAEVDAHMKERDKLYHKSIPESNAEENHSVNDLLQGSELIEPISVVSPEIVVSECDTEQGATGVTPDVSHYQIAFDSNMELDSNGQNLDFDDQLEKLATLSSCSSDMEITLKDRSKDVDNEKDTDRQSVSSDQDMDLERFSVLSDDSSDIEFKYGKKESANDMDLALEKYCGLSTDSSEGDCERFEICHHGPLLTVPYKSVKKMQKKKHITVKKDMPQHKYDSSSSLELEPDNGEAPDQSERNSKSKKISFQNVKSNRSDPQLTLKQSDMFQTNSVPKAKALIMPKDPAPKTMSSGELAKSEKRQQVQLEQQKKIPLKKNKNIIKVSEVSESPKCNHIVGSSSSSASNIVGPERHDTQSELGTKGLLKKSKSKDRLGLSCVKMRTTSPFEAASNPERDIVVKESEKLEKPKSVYKRVTSQFSKPFVKKKSKSKLVDEENVLATLRDTDSTSDNLIPTDDKFKSPSPAMNISEEPKNLDSMPRRRFNKPDWFKTYLLPEEQKSSTQIDNDNNDGLSGDVKSKDKCSIIIAVQSDTYDSFPSNLSKYSSAKPPPVSKGVATNKKQTVDILADTSASNQQTCQERTNLIKEPKAELSKIGLASRKKISPGVIHTLNPCSSGWLEGGLEAEVEQNKHVGYMPTVHCASERGGGVERPLRDKTVKVSALDFDLTAVNIKSEIDESNELAMQETKESVDVDAHNYPNTGPLPQNLKTMGEESAPLEVSKVDTSVASSKGSEKGTGSLEEENTAMLSTIVQPQNKIVEDKLCQRKWKYKTGKPKIEGIDLRDSTGLRINLLTEGNCDLLALKDNRNPEKLTGSEPLEDLDKSQLIKDERLKEVVPRISDLEIDEQSRKAINVYNDVSIDRIERRIIIDNSCKLIEKKSLSGNKGICFEKDLISVDDSKLNVLDKQKTPKDKADQCSIQHMLFPQQMVDKNCDVTKEDNNNGANIKKDSDDNNDATIEFETDINQNDDGMDDYKKNVNKDKSGSENECYFTSLTDVSVLQDSNMHGPLDDDDIPYADDDHCQDTSGSDKSVLASGPLAKTLILETEIDTSGSNISVLESGLSAKTLFSEPKTSRSEISVITCRSEVEHHNKATPCSLSNDILCECNFHSPKYSESDNILPSVDKGTIPYKLSITDNRKESLECSQSVDETKSLSNRLPFTEDGTDAVQSYIPDQLPCTENRLCPEELASNTNVILCECNFRPVIVTDLDGASWYEEDDDIETICSYTDDKVPIIIEDSPYVPKKRILKPSFSAENILNPGPKKGVRFHSNLPTWKKRSWRSESNLRRRFNKVKDSEEEKKKHIENFIMCMFEQEPRNLALMGEAVGRNDYSDSIADSDLILKSDSKESRTAGEQELSLNSYTSFIQHKRNTDVINYEEILGDDEKGSNLESFGNEENGDGCFAKSHLENPRKDTDKSQSDTDLMNVADQSITHHSYNNDSPAYINKAKKSPTIAKQFKPNSPKIFVPISYKSSLSASESVAKCATTSASAELCLNYNLNDPAYVATGGTKLDILSDLRSDHTYSEINDKKDDDDNECQQPENENFQVADIHDHHHSDENKTRPLLDWKTYLKSYQIFKSKIHRRDTKFGEYSQLKKEFGSNTVLNPNRDTYADVSFLGAKIEENWNQIENIPSKEKDDDIKLMNLNEHITPQENTLDLNSMKMKKPLPQTSDVYSVPTDYMTTEDFKKDEDIEIDEATFEKEKAKSKTVISDNPCTITGKTTRYVCTIPDETDPDSPKIKSVTYEYVTEYRLNNVKVDYQYSKQVQTENA